MVMVRYSIEIELDSSNFCEEVIDASNEFPDLLWSSSDGIHVVSCEIESNDVVADVRKISRRLFSSNLPVSPLRWHDDFIGYSEIGRYVGMTSEAIRLLASGQRGAGDFPKPRGFIGIAVNRSPFWPWAEVSNWFNINYEIKDEEHFPTSNQIIEINYSIAQLSEKHKSKIKAAI